MCAAAPCWRGLIVDRLLLLRLQAFSSLICRCGCGCGCCGWGSPFRRLLQPVKLSPLLVLLSLLLLPLSRLVLLLLVPPSRLLQPAGGNSCWCRRHCCCCRQRGRSGFHPGGPGCLVRRVPVLERGSVEKPHLRLLQPRNLRVCLLRVPPWALEYSGHIRRADTERSSPNMLRVLLLTPFLWGPIRMGRATQSPGLRTGASTMHFSPILTSCTRCPVRPQGYLNALPQRL